ncbi:MAG TPA: hypothetical protein VJ124_16790 [Pyrinomonadaceae bacterium]|nr:hypothetical protein [Pyrinomonadaceae bacterium]
MLSLRPTAARLAITATILLLLLLFPTRLSFRSANLVASSQRLSRVPSLVLWAWERPERLRFTESQKVGVAFLAKTIYLRGDKTVIRPRLQPLDVRDDTPLIAVARIEIDREEPPTLSRQQSTNASREIVVLAHLPQVVAVQVDFDAARSEREFYRRLLFELRQTLPETTALSMTALVSWCKGDNWLDQLPVDEAVPMLFRMGVERDRFLSHLSEGSAFSAKPCRNSMGISTDEPLALPVASERLYVFNPKPWSANTITKTMENARK